MNKVIKQLCFLDSFQTVQDFNNLTTTDVKVVWNYLLSDRYHGSKLEYSTQEKKELMSNVEIEKFTVPVYLQKLQNIFGPTYFNDVYRYQQFTASKELFFISYITYLLRTDLKGASLSSETSEWFGTDSTEKSLKIAEKIPKVMLATWFWDKGLQDQFDLLTQSGCLGWIGCFNQWIFPEIKGYIHQDWFQQYLNAPSALFDYAEEFGLSNYLVALWYSDKDLQNWLDIHNPIQAKQCVEWFFNEKVHTLTHYQQPEWLARKFPLTSNSHKIVLDSDPSETVLMESTDINAVKRLSAIDGINIIGWPRTEIGIGEDARVAYDALNPTNTDIVLIDAAHRMPPSPKQTDLGYDQYLASEPVFNTDIVYLDAATQFRYYAHDLLHDNFLENKRIIAVSPWELPEWPEELGYIFNHVDVFWAATRYIYDAFAPFFKDKVIQLAPPAVVVPAEEIDDFDVVNVEGTFVFLTTFDGLSSIHRKNPFAVVAAFLGAFPKNKSDDVRLIVKTMNFQPENPELTELASKIASDNRIEIVNAALSKSELNALIRTTHCFVSLHRAEGFGRNIAEMMLFNRPVIVSRFSGNLDFCFEDNSYLVDGTMIDVGEHYWYSKNQQWFDASIDHAAQYMKDVYQNREQASIKAKKAKEYMSSFHSIEETGKRYKQLLDEL